jgi:hypothetical protein
VIRIGGASGLQLPHGARGAVCTCVREGISNFFRGDGSVVLECCRSVFLFFLFMFSWARGYKVGVGHGRRVRSCLFWPEFFFLPFEMKKTDDG